MIQTRTQVSLSLTTNALAGSTKYKKQIINAVAAIKNRGITDRPYSLRFRRQVRQAG
jgi:hypothetical protein